MQHPPSTIKKAFKLVSDIEKHLQVTDSFKLEFPSYPTNELNEMSAKESSVDEVELNEMSRGKRWGNNIIAIRNILVLATSQLQLQTPTKQTSGQLTRQTVGKTKGLQDHFDTGVRPLRTH